MRIKELEEKIRFLEGEVEKGRETSRKVKKLSSLFERWRAELYHKSDLLNQFRSVMNAPELMLDDQWRIIGYSSQFVRLCPQVIELARRKAHLGEVLADGEFSRIEERIGQIAALARLPYQEDQGWKLEYSGPNGRNEISRLWQVHCTCTRKNWEIAERDGELRLVHRAHAEDEVDCYLITRRQFGGPDHDLKVVYRFRTAKAEEKIRDVSLVISGSSGNNKTLPDLIGYTVCLGSYFNSQRRIQRQGGSMVSLAEDLEPDTAYQATVERQGGRITSRLVNLDRNEQLPAVQFIDNDPVYGRLNHIGLTTYSGYLEIYGLEIYTRRSRFSLEDFRVPFKLQVQLRAADVADRIFSLRLTKEASPGVTRQTLFFEDITERLGGETAIRESEEKYRQLFEMESDSIFLIDNETGKILEVNPAATVLYGYSRDEFLRMRNVDVSAEPRETSRATRQGLTTVPIRYHRRKEGTVFPVEISARHFLFRGREVHVAAIRDITEKIQAQKELEENWAFLRDVIDSMPDTVMVNDREGRIILASRNMIDSEEADEKEALGKTILECPPYLEKSDLILQENLEILNGRKKRIQKELSFTKKSGMKVWRQITKLPLVSKSGEIDRMITLVSDITGRKRLEEESLRAQKIESLGVLAGGIAHDFNNILTSVLGNVSLARLLDKDLNRKNEILVKAEKAILRAKELTQQLLAFSSGGEPVKQITSLRELVTESAEFVLRSSNVKCEFDFADDLQAVDADPGQISRVIQNLAINADQAMPDGGRIYIHLRNRKIASGEEIDLAAGRFVEIEIEDEGLGIPAEYIDRIFDPYFTTKKRGSGLGLAASYSIVQKHDGKISVTSRPGRGAVFRVLLPAAPAKMGKKRIQADGRSVGESRILLMDDEKMVRETLLKMLAHLGCEAVATVNGEEVVAEYRKEASAGRPYDVVILDLTVSGGMGGSEAIARLRQEFPEVKAVVTSGYSNDPVLSDYRKYGFSGAIVKPFKIDDLSQALQAVMRDRQKKN